MHTFMICGRHAFDAQEKQAPRERCPNFSILSCCPSLGNIQDTSKSRGSLQSTISWRLFNFVPKAFSLSRSSNSMRKLLSTIRPCFSRLTPLSLFFILFISESVTLNPFVQMKLSPMRWRLHQTAPAVSGNMGIEP